MCVPGAAQIAQMAVNTVSVVGKSILDFNQQSKANEYRTQIAINNIKTAQDEARRQAQLGINKSREEKIEGIKRASAMMTQYASSNVDALSDSNYQNLVDTKNTSFTNAENILNQYNQNADKYFDKAKSYLYDYKMDQKNYRNSLFKTALNSLGSYSKVASSWYSYNNGSNNNGTIKSSII